MNYENKKGLIYIFTGEGKGKTSAALGVATRALLLDKQVGWVAFYKQSSWGLAEAKLNDKFSNLEMIFEGRGFRITNYELRIKGKTKVATVGNKGNVVVDTASEEEHLQAARTSLVQAAELLKKKPFLLVMDEILNAISDGLVDEKEVMKVIEKRGESHIVLTGRGATDEIVKAADLVTECKKIKHPYDEGKLAVAGLDY